MKTLVSKFLVAALFLHGFAFTVFADAMDNWTACNVSTNPVGGVLGPYGGLILSGVTCGHGRYVGVGTIAFSDYGAIETSDDGINWTMRTTLYPSMLQLFAAAYGNGTFVAVGYDYYGGNNLDYSTNGINWAGPAAPTDCANFYGVAYGDGYFVAVGDGTELNSNATTNKNIYFSADGINWTAVSSGVPANDVSTIYDVAYGAGRFVAVGGPYTAASNPYIYVSVVSPPPSGGPKFWTQTVSDYPPSGSVSYCNGQFIVPAGPGTNLFSPDGSNWSVVTNNAGVTFSRVFYTNGLYIALSSPVVFTSADGTNWVRRNVPTPTNGVLTGIALGNRNVVAVGYKYQNSWGQPLAFISDPFVALGMMAGATPELNLSGVNGWSYGVQFSDTLNPANWQSLTNLTLSNSPCIWQDATATNGQRFYRAALSMH